MRIKLLPLELQVTKKSENPSLILEEKSGQPSENVSLPASAPQCAPSEAVENQELSAINVPAEDVRYLESPTSVKNHEETIN